MQTTIQSIMKKIILSAIVALCATIAYAGTVTDTVTTGLSYTNQIWYSLPNGSVKSTPKDNWDVAFQIYGYAASVLVNTQKGMLAFQSPYVVADWASVDTAGMDAWQKLQNSDTSWNYGALNTNPDGNYDLGWGVYDMNTHYVTGDSIFVLKLANSGAWIKFRMNELANGSYSFTWANLDGSNEQTASVSKNSYTGKNFAYFSLANNSPLDNEPLSAEWDVTFTKYITPIFSQGEWIPYGVTGLLQNKNVNAVKAYPVADVNNVNYGSFNFQSAINTIGYDWKSYDMNTSSYMVLDSAVYFVKRSNGDIWKIIFLEFGGSANGNYIFSKELVFTATTSVEENTSTQWLSVFPNPTKGQFNLVFNSNEVTHSTLRIFDLSGRLLLEDNLLLQNGINQHTINTGNLQQGVYLLSLNGNKSIKLIVE